MKKCTYSSSIVWNQLTKLSSKSDPRHNLKESFTTLAACGFIFDLELIRLARRISIKMKSSISPSINNGLISSTRLACFSLSCLFDDEPITVRNKKPKTSAR